MPVVFKPCGTDAVAAKIGHTEVVLRFLDGTAGGSLGVRVIHWTRREFARQCHVEDGCPCSLGGCGVPETCAHWASFYLPDSERGFECGEAGEARERLAALLGQGRTGPVATVHRIDGFEGGEVFEGADGFLAEPWYVRGKLHGAL